MGILIDTSLQTQPTKLNTSYPINNSGFQDQLNEAIKASDRISTSKAGKENEQNLYQLNDSVNQLIHSGKKQNAINMGNHRLSSGMLNLYLAQERKDERSGKGRALS